MYDNLFFSNILTILTLKNKQFFKKTSPVEVPIAFAEEQGYI